MAETEQERAARYAALERKAPTVSADEMPTRTRRSVLTGAGAIAASFLGWRWIQTQPEDDNIPSVLRDVHEVNERIWRGAFRDDHLAPTFDRSESSKLRVNGRRGGLDQEIDLDAWSMRIVDDGGQQIGDHVLDDILALPQHEMTVEHKCVEGWSHVVTWGGARFSDFVAAFYSQYLDEPTEYVSLTTPDRGYFVGLEWDAMMHPQTLLCHSLQGEPLEQLHGAPLRLVTPLKYGIKQIKRIGSIRFTDERPDDYWALRGYDWYAGL